MAKNTAQSAQRQYAHLDSIAIQRHAADLRRKEQAVEAAEASMNAVLINPGGVQAHGYMAAQCAQRVAELREQHNAVLALDGDERVLHYLADIIAQDDAPLAGEVTINGAPLNRGARSTSVPPGYGMRL